MFTPAQFRQRFREFADPELYQESSIEFWADLAATLMPADRWGAILDYGISLFVAHHLAISQRNEQAAEIGGALGVVNGPQTQKAVDKVSASYDTSAVSLTDAGFWNLTTYGIRFLQQARMIGAGGIQL